MTWAIFIQAAIDFLKSQWKGLAVGVALTCVCYWLFADTAKPVVQVQAVQAQSGEIKAGGTLKIASVPARPATPCPPKGTCPPCPEIPAITLDFGSSAKGGQTQSITATVNADNTTHFSLGLVGGYTFSPINTVQIGIKAQYGPVFGLGLYGLEGSWTGLVGYTVLRR